MSNTQLRLAKTSEKEIDSLFAILNEAERLSNELKNNFLEDIDFSEFETMQYFDRENTEQFLTDFVKHLSSIHFQRILFNCQTLLDNCADPDLDTLDFNKDIKRGLELLEAQTQDTERQKSMNELGITEQDVADTMPSEPVFK